jgi:hypothetical protein
MAHEAAHPRLAPRPVEATSAASPSYLRLVHVAPVGDAQPHPRARQTYCPPAPTGSLVHLYFRRLFWGAPFHALVGPPEPEGVR